MVQKREMMGPIARISTCCMVFATFLTVSTSAQMPGGSGLPGSCVAAGHTGCCRDGCMGDSNVCFCDPSCERYGDCCSDIYEICDPDIAALFPLIPTVKYIESVTYHTLHLHWIVSHTNRDFNGTYRVSINRRTSVNTSLAATSGSSQYSVPIVSTGGMELGNQYALRLEDLEQDSEYEYGISVVTEAAILEDAGSGTFRTRKYPSIDNITVELTDSFAVHVSWLHPAIAEGVSINHFRLYYHPVTPEEGEGGEGAAHDRTLHSTVVETSVTVEGLDMHQAYRFEVAAVILEANGRVYEILETENAPEIFIPDSFLFQLTVTSSLTCEEWNLQREREVVDMLHSAVIEQLWANCSCPYPSRNLHEETLIPICTNTTPASSRPHMQITYRARLLTVAGYSQEELLQIIDSWRNSANSLQSSNDGALTDTLDCPTRIEYATQPICRTAVIASAATAEGCPVTVTTLLAALLGELALLMVLMVLAVLATLYFTKDRRKRWSEGERESHAVENHYSGVPSPLTRDGDPRGGGGKRK